MQNKPKKKQRYAQSDAGGPDGLEASNKPNKRAVEKLGSFEFISSELLDDTPSDGDLDSPLDHVPTNNKPGTVGRISDLVRNDSHAANQRGVLTSRKLNFDSQSGHMIEQPVLKGSQSTKNQRVEAETASENPIN